MKKLFFILLISCMGMSVWAQQKNRPCLTPEEFKAKQEAFITEKADLTKSEAAKFFPIFFKLQSQKKALNDKAWKLIKKGKNAETTEAEYEQIIEEVLDSKIKADELEKEYYQKFKQILSAKKIYKVQHAEMRFHRELLKDVKRNSGSTKNKK